MKKLFSEDEQEIIKGDLSAQEKRSIDHGKWQPGSLTMTSVKFG